MSQKAKNLDKAFRQVRLFCALMVLSSTTLAGYSVYKSYMVSQKAASRIYILAGGKALEAFAGDRRENIPVEARDHVRTFHQYFFTLDPDDQVVESNMDRALYLADASAKKVYESLRENNYYSGIISGNISQQVSVDSVAVQVDSEPFYFRCFATLTITRPSSVTIRSLLTEGYLRPVSRSDHNPHGFLIEKWKTMDNKDLKTESR